MGQAINMSDKAKPKAVAKAKKPEASHPPSSVMVKAALENLKERKGSSLIAIKKYIATNYKADPVKMSVFIKKALASGVEKKTILQVKGVGMSGRFKIAKEEAKPKKAAKPRRQSKRLLHQSQRRRLLRRLNLQRKPLLRKRLRRRNPPSHQRNQRNLWRRKQRPKSRQQRLLRRRNNLLFQGPLGPFQGH